MKDRKEIKIKIVLKKKALRLYRAKCSPEKIKKLTIGFIIWSKKSIQGTIITVW